MAKIETTTLSPSACTGVLLAAAIAEVPLFFWGPPGVGKSALAQQVATQLNKAFIDVRLSQMDPTDVRGMPYKVEEDGVTVGVEWSPPLMFPKNLDKTAIRNIEAIETEINFSSANPTGSNGIHYVKEPQIEVRALDPSLSAQIIEQSADRFTVKVIDASVAESLPNDTEGRLAAIIGAEAREGRIRYRIVGEAEAIIGYEEMNSAPPSVLAACYQIILDRRIGNYVMPKGVAQFAMGNRETDKGVTFKMPTPLSNRFDHIEIKPHFADWQVWAIKSLVHPDVVGYLSAFEGQMFQFNAGTAARGFATPRSWVMVSKILKALDAGLLQVTDEQLQAMIYGAVGDGVGAEFFEFRKIAKALPSPRDVLAGRIKDLPAAKDKDKTGLQFALTTSLLYVLKETHMDLDAKGFREDSKSKERNEWYESVDNYIEFSLNNFKTEVNVMGVRQALQMHQLPINGMRCKQWPQFVKRHKEVMIDS
jgi:hypothetical protein